MKKVIVPEDIKRIGRGMIIKRLVWFDVILVCSLLILYFANDWLNAISRENKIITYVFFISLPFVLLGFPHKLIDKTWSGTVINSDVRRVLCKDFNHKYFYIKKWRPVVDIIKDEDDFITETTTNVQIKEDGHLDMYAKGCKVVHVYGCEYLYVIPKKATDPVVCVVCGMKNFNEEDNAGNRGLCKGCGHSLDIRFEDNKAGRYYR